MTDLSTDSRGHHKLPLRGDWGRPDSQSAPAPQLEHTSPGLWCLAVMPEYGDCKKCIGRHQRPVGGKCKYFKLAIDKCRELGVDSSEYLLHLPDLVDSDPDGEEGHTGASMLSPRRGTPSRVPVTDGLVKELLIENATYKRQLLEQRGEIEKLTSDMALLLRECKFEPPVTTAGASYVDTVTSSVSTTNSVPIYSVSAPTYLFTSGQCQKTNFCFFTE